MGEYELRINGTWDYEVAAALAYLAGFPKGTAIRLRCGNCVPGTSRAVIVFHPATIEQDLDLFLATQNPDIEVRRFLDDKYSILVGQRVDESLIDKLEEAIRNGPPENASV